MLKGNTTMENSLTLAVFVPTTLTGPIASLVARGSAIVGSLDTDTVDYEGNIYGSENIKTFADRARQAAGRQMISYPTEARSTVPQSELRQVGWFSLQNGITLLNDAQAREALASWLGVEVIEEKELGLSRL